MRIDYGPKYEKDDNFKAKARLHQSEFRVEHLRANYKDYGNRLAEREALEGKNFYPELEVSRETEDKYIDYCSRIVDEHISSELRRDLRMGMYMRRIPIAIARASFENVTDTTLNQAFKMIKEAVRQWETG